MYVTNNLFDLIQKPMILRQALYDRQNNRRYPTFPQVAERRITWVVLAKRLVDQDKMTFSRCMRMFSIRYALVKRYFSTRYIGNQATDA